MIEKSESRGSNSILIKHVTGDEVAGGNKRKCTSSWYTKVVHCLTAKELPDAAAEDGKAIGKATVRSLASSFKLKFPPFRVRIQYLP